MSGQLFWNDDIKANVDLFQGEESGFFAADWNLKVRVIDSVFLFIIDSVFLSFQVENYCDNSLSYSLGILKRSKRL